MMNWMLLCLRTGTRYVIKYLFCSRDIKRVKTLRVVLFLARSILCPNNFEPNTRHKPHWMSWRLA
jgi:hypothetical protein